MSDQPRPGMLFGGLPVEGAAEPAAGPPAPAPAPEPACLPNVHQGPRPAVPQDEGAKINTILARFR